MSAASSPGPSGYHFEKYPEGPGDEVGYERIENSWEAEEQAYMQNRRHTELRGSVISSFGPRPE